MCDYSRNHDDDDDKSDDSHALNHDDSPCLQPIIDMNFSDGASQARAPVYTDNRNSNHQSLPHVASLIASSHARDSQQRSYQTNMMDGAQNSGWRLDRSGESSGMFTQSMDTVGQYGHGAHLGTQFATIPSGRVQILRGVMNGEGSQLENWSQRSS